MALYVVEYDSDINHLTVMHVATVNHLGMVLKVDIELGEIHIVSDLEMEDFKQGWKDNNSHVGCERLELKHVSFKNLG